MSTASVSVSVVSQLSVSKPDPNLKQIKSAKIERGLSDIYGENIRLTTYTSDADVDPIKTDWYNADPKKRGPVVPSKFKNGLGKHNAIGAHGGPYSIYHALSIGTRQLDSNHIADYTSGFPSFDFPQVPEWSEPGKIVSLDPFGHMTPWLYNSIGKKEGVEVRPSMAITKAVLSIPEIRGEVQKGNLKPDGKVVLNEDGDMACTKVAVDPVWYLPGVAERLGISEADLRRALFEDTNGMYPELVTRPDIKVFCPPIGGCTAYIFGNPANLHKEDKRLSVRVHDECCSSDVFLSDICSCRCYLIFGLVEAAREAQNGGNGMICYFRKEGRCLGEVTKYMVYNARKRCGDTADNYFPRTECIAGVKDARFQELMPDILHWFGIKTIDRMLSMSNLKYDAIIKSGIDIKERVEIPDYLLPADCRVEIDAKIASGYFTNGHRYTDEELKKVEGRQWQNI
ncbi:Putative GTP cyclohydrolase [Brettanomyces nanus]|uniref:GTP cyclohydrolase n=1 Tax=Eeniella nana TaxID=13502 RepID=A0A875S6C7_EENNA|nr:Putative GTP cyclohydrolase [Brettanomyces nanus]QPG76498.1 Putative GTP cyclohydrolase [Brettanomyces nanus]